MSFFIFINNMSGYSVTMYKAAKSNFDSRAFELRQFVHACYIEKVSEADGFI